MWRIFFFFLLLCVSAFASDPTTVTLVGGGSSVPLPLYKKWKEAYNKRHESLQMEYVPFGSAEGIEQVANGKSDFAAGEVLLSPQQRAKNDLIALPVAIIAIVPAFNVPGVRELRFSGELLAEIFLGDVKNWNDPKIARLNPDVSFPNMPIQVVYRPGGKGTNYVFTDFLSKTSPRFAEKIGRTPSPIWQVGVPAEQSADMAQKIKTTPGSLGYLELQYVDHQQLSSGSVLNPSGKYVKASNESILAACRAVEGTDSSKLVASLTNASGSDSYPIASFTWIYVREKPAQARRAAALSDLLTWMFSDGQKLALSEGYPGLPDSLLANIKAVTAAIHANQ